MRRGVFHASLPTIKWLLNEGGARITDRDHDGSSALLEAASCGIIPTCQWFLEHGGADIADETYDGVTIWDMVQSHYTLLNMNAAVSALLRVMVLKSDPPAGFVARMRPEYKRVVEEGARLRAALPAYLAQRRALLDAHCPLIAPLLSLVRDYDPEPTTTEEIWATWLGAALQHARRPRVDAAVALPVRRRLRQRLE
jgi:hypothetical protein